MGTGKREGGGGGAKGPRAVCQTSVANHVKSQPIHIQMCHNSQFVFLDQAAQAEHYNPTTRWHMPPYTRPKALAEVLVNSDMSAST